MKDKSNLLTDIELSNKIQHNSSNRIGKDTTLWELLSKDQMIIFFSILCGFSYQTDPTKSLQYNTLSKVWYVFLICLTLVGISGYILDLILTVDPAFNSNFCIYGNPSLSKDSSTIIKNLFVLILLPLSQIASVCYSFYSIKELLSQSADDDCLSMYKSSLRGSYWFLFTMVFNVFIVFVTAMSTMSSSQCSLGILFMMSCFNFSITFYTAFIVFILSANITKITNIQENILYQAKQKTLTLNTYLQERENVNKLHHTVLWSTQILVINALLNVLAWILSYFAMSIIYNIDSVKVEIYMFYADSALFLKELVFFLFIALRSVKINTLSDDLSESLSKSDWLTDGNIEKDHLRLSLYVCCSYDPVSFTILSKRVSKSDIYTYIVGIVSAVIGKFIQTAIKAAE